MRSERIQLVQKYIAQKDMVTIKELCDHFGVSVNTVRRDLNVLEKENRIRKVYGGARRVTPEIRESDPNFLISYSQRNIKNPEEKRIIAKKAVSYVHEDDTIFIDTGTSTVSMMQYLKSFRHLTILTNSIYVMYYGIEARDLNIIGLPGVVKSKTASLVGAPCLDMLDNYVVNKAFMACSSFSLEYGVANSSMEEYSIKKKVMERSLEHFLLVDSSKFDKSSLIAYAQPKDFQYIITERMPSSKYTDYFNEHQVQLVLAK